MYLCRCVYTYVYIYNSDTACVFQNLNKQAYDLAKALLKRTAQAIEPYITNVSFACGSRRIKRNFKTVGSESQHVAHTS